MWIDDEGKIHRNQNTVNRNPPRRYEPWQPPEIPRRSTTSSKAVWIVISVVVVIAASITFFIYSGFFSTLTNNTGDYLQAAQTIPTPEGMVPPSTPLPPTISTESEIRVGSVVTIQEGAVYGGLASARGRVIPRAQLAPATHVINEIRIHHNEYEARLERINSWVALRYLRLANE